MVWHELDYFFFANSSAVSLIVMMLVVLYTSNAILTNDNIESTADNETVDKRLDESVFLNLMTEINWPINGR